jgi:hypothetical protein
MLNDKNIIQDKGSGGLSGSIIAGPNHISL